MTLQNNNTDNFLKELISKQRNKIPSDKKLQYNDLRRISKYISNSIFDEQKCCIWNGYITNTKNKNKGTYVNFYFRNKKMALHRLLYVNFVDSLSEDEYLKFSCENRGSCCNIYHMKKFKYNNAIDENNNTKKNLLIKHPIITVKQICTNFDKNKHNELFIDFDL